jgi:hypothetical protein
MVYRFLTTVLFFIFVLNASISRAGSDPETSRIWKVNNKESNTFYFLYEENDKYIVNKIRVPEKRLQEILEKRFFTSYDDALKFIKSQNVTSIQKNKLHFSKIQTEVPGSIWPTLNEWSWEWEKKYADWIKDNFDEDFFVKYNIKTDCADVEISLRWIFSRINFLPAAQTTVLSDRVFSNESVRAEWKNLPTSENWYEDKKFLAGLDFILDNTYTHSLYFDSYPILIDKSSLLLGTHYLKLRENGGHTLIVQEFVNGRTIYTLSSDVPRMVRRMDKYGFWYTYQPKYYPAATAGGGGFVRMRWPRKIAGGYELVPREEMPFYSLEQYDADFIKNPRNDFAEEVHNRLGDTSTPMDRYSTAVSRLITIYKARVSIVENGFEFCSKNNCSEGTENYENYSTPERDAKITDTIKIVEQMTRDYNDSDPEIPEDWKEKLESIVVTIQDHPMSLSQLIDIWKEAKYSYDPKSPILERWGISSER